MDKWIGTFVLSADTKGKLGAVTIGVSGNSRQRRLIVRRWKARGYTVAPFKPHGAA